MTRVRISDVAARAGVSVGTVSNVLNGLPSVSADVATRVRTVIDELGYVRNDAARQLRVGKSLSVGFVVLDTRNPFFTDVARGAEVAAARQGIGVLLASSGEDPERERAHLELFRGHSVRGVLISPVGNVESGLIEMRRAGTPVVLVDRESASGLLSSVSVDDVAGGELAARHLLAAGRRRLAFVGGPLGLVQVSERLSGARAAVSEFADATLEVLPTVSLTVEEGRRVGAGLLAREPRSRPDAVFAANDLVAVGLLQALVMTGSARIPEDIALVGYDDIEFAASTVIPLTSVRQPSERIGQSALEILLAETDRSVAPIRLRFEPELTVRASAP